MSLCMPCQAIVDENPLAVLIRRDEDGNNLLCNNCRRTIYLKNNNAQNGFHNFTFERPTLTPMAKDTSQALCGVLGVTKSASLNLEGNFAAWQHWYCQLCKSRVWAQPRVFDGENEPEDWWWCNTCKRERQEQMHAAESKAEEKKEAAQMLGKKLTKADRVKQQLESYPKLDKWLLHK